MTKTVNETVSDPCGSASADSESIAVTCDPTYFCNDAQYTGNGNLSGLCYPICYDAADDEQCCDNEEGADEVRYCTTDPNEECFVLGSATTPGQYSCSCADSYLDVGGTCYETLNVALVLGGCVLFVFVVLGVALTVMTTKYRKEKKKNR